MAGLTLSKPNKFVISFLLISFFSLLALESSEARRMGGGRSFGKMPPIKRQATTPPKPAENASPKNAPNAAASKRGGMGMLGGLAAGLGLAALASYLGIGEELMGLLVILGICFLFFVAFRAFFSKGLARMALAGGSPERFPQTRVEESPENTNKKGDEGAQYADGNFEWEIPEKEKFLEVAKSKFIELQEHWSSGDLAKLENFCTSGLMEHLSREFKEEDRLYSNLSVVELNAFLEGSKTVKETSGEKAVLEVYIRFNGLMRDSDSLPIKFNEVWTLQKTNIPNQGWLLAGIFQDEQLD